MQGRLKVRMNEHCADAIWAIRDLVVVVLQEKLVT
jgi:hypothetical protein